jgi:hypothetical protein
MNLKAWMRRWVLSPAEHRILAALNSDVRQLEQLWACRGVLDSSPSLIRRALCCNRNAAKQLELLEQQIQITRGDKRINADVLNELVDTEVALAELVGELHHVDPALVSHCFPSVTTRPPQMEMWINRLYPKSAAARFTPKVDVRDERSVTGEVP